MKKIQKIGMRVAIAAVFATTLLVSVGPKSGISAARADDPGTGTGTEADTGTMSGVFTNFYTTDEHGKQVLDHVGYCCASGKKTCTPYNCP